MFHAAYESAWQQPGMAFIGALPVLVAGVVLRRTSLVRMLVVLELLVLLDAWLTGPLSPLSGTMLTVAVSAFVVIGDLRFFYLVQRRMRTALPIALVLPLTLGVAHVVWPPLSGTRFFLVYEAAFIPLALVVTRYAAVDEQRAGYVWRIGALVVTQYALWALSDALILGGFEAAWLLRVVPNALYYVAFVPVATLRVRR